MAKLRGLINGQDVAFDTHQAGDAQNVNWSALHLEKRLHGGRGKARYPLFGNEKESSSGMNQDDFERITREVKKALKKNEQLLKDLAKTIVVELERFSNGEATSKDAREAARNISGYFDLDPNFLRVVEEYSNKHLSSITTIHFNPIEKTLHEIHQTKGEVVIQKPRLHNSLRRIFPRTG